MKSQMVDSNTGDLYIVDSYNFRIRQVKQSTGIITSIVGTGINGYSGDDGLATAATISSVFSITFDPYNGVLYIADRTNYRIRAIFVPTGIISTIAGTGISGFSGDNGRALFSTFRECESIAINPLSGVIYLSDHSNKRIRKLSFNFNCSLHNSCNSHGTCVSFQNCSCYPKWNLHDDCSVRDSGVNASHSLEAVAVYNGTTNCEYCFL